MKQRIRPDGFINSGCSFIYCNVLFKYVGHKNLFNFYTSHFYHYNHFIMSEKYLRFFDVIAFLGAFFSGILDIVHNYE